MLLYLEIKMDKSHKMSKDNHIQVYPQGAYDDDVRYSSDADSHSLPTEDKPEGKLSIIKK